MTILQREIKATTLTRSSANLLVPFWLMSSYMYYCENESMFSDPFWDAMSARLAASWPNVQHRHKYLISPVDLNATGAYLNAESYPSLVKGGAWAFMKA